MQEQIANLVHPVINYGLRLKERLEAGERLDLNAEQAALKGLLLTDLEARRWADFGGELGSDQRNIRVTRPGDSGRIGMDGFLGIRYALVCWLDEIFILDTVWSADWNEQKLETALYGTNLRAEMFWEQAGRAETRPGSDALEVYFLCVMLGFRGELRYNAAKLQTWVSNTRGRIARNQGQEWPAPPSHDPTTNVPPRFGRERFQRVIVGVGLVVLGIIPVLAYIFVNTNLFR